MSEPELELWTSDHMPQAVCFLVSKCEMAIQEVILHFVFVFFFSQVKIHSFYSPDFKNNIVITKTLKQYGKV